MIRTIDIDSVLRLCRSFIDNALTEFEILCYLDKKEQVKNVSGYITELFVCLSNSNNQVFSLHWTPAYSRPILLYNTKTQVQSVTFLTYKRLLVFLSYVKPKSLLRFSFVLNQQSKHIPHALTEVYVQNVGLCREIQQVKNAWKVLVY